MLNLLLISFSLLHSTISYSQGNAKILSFKEAKPLLEKIHTHHQYTLYCGCKYSGKTVDLKSCGYKVHKDAKRAARKEWEHVVPAEAFGKSFAEWRTGSPNCIKRGKKYKGRKCARKNPVFAKMEADLFNLYPEIGELNGLRSNYSMTAFGKRERRPSSKTFGECKAIVSDRKFEPMDMAKGIVARTYMYMHKAYPGKGIISEKNTKLFGAWHQMFPVTEWECKRARAIASVQGNVNEFVEKDCGNF
jgi:deoxyribonuclease I